MRKPKAQTISADTPTKTKDSPKQTMRAPRAFSPSDAKVAPPVDLLEADPTRLPAELAQMQKPRKNRILQIALWAGGLFVSMGLALMADRLIADLFNRYEWLGWAGMAVLSVFVLTLIALAIREFMALSSLSNLDRIRHSAQQVLATNMPEQGKSILMRLQQLYATRPDLARARQQLDTQHKDLLDGADMVGLAETTLMQPLDARARALTSAAARRVAIVTAISPRAIVDIAFVAYESFKLARAIASLYGARPGLLGALRLGGEILGHLAVTGGVALGDSVVQQLLGHGLAAKLSARLGEGLVNGLMTVRVGIAAMRVTRPLPYDRFKQPKVMDFMADLASITTQPNNS